MNNHQAVVCGRDIDAAVGNRREVTKIVSTKLLQLHHGYDKVVHFGSKF